MKDEHTNSCVRMNWLFTCFGGYLPLSCIFEGVLSVVIFLELIFTPFCSEYKEAPSFLTLQPKSRIFWISIFFFDPNSYYTLYWVLSVAIIGSGCTCLQLFICFPMLKFEFVFSFLTPFFNSKNFEFLPQYWKTYIIIADQDFLQSHLCEESSSWHYFTDFPGSSRSYLANLAVL